MGIGQGGFLVPGAVKIEPRQILAYSFRVILLESNTHTYILSSGESPRVKTHQPCKHKHTDIYRIRNTRIQNLVLNLGQSDTAHWIIQQKLPN